MKQFAYFMCNLIVINVLEPLTQISDDVGMSEVSAKAFWFRRPDIPDTQWRRVNIVK